MSDKLPGIRPRLSLLHRLDVAGRYAFPAGSTAAIMLALSAPLGLPGQPQLQSGFVLGAVYFWSVFRPASLPSPLVFLIGLLLDLLTGAPLAVGCLILLLTHAIALNWRYFLARQGFLFVWLVFTAIAAGAWLLAYLLQMLLTWQLLSPAPAVFGFAVSAGLYPNLAVLLTRAHRGIAAPERA